MAFGSNQASDDAGVKPPIAGGDQAPHGVRLVPASPADQSSAQVTSPSQDGQQTAQGELGEQQNVGDPTPTTDKEGKLLATIRSSPVITESSVMDAATKYQVPLPITFGSLNTREGKGWWLQSQPGRATRPSIVSNAPEIGDPVIFATGIPTKGPTWTPIQNRSVK